MTSSSGHGHHDAYAVLRLRDFRLLVSGNVLSSFATAILSIIVAWELYERTDSAFILGLVGLVQIIPNLVLAIPAGSLVDRTNPRTIAAVALGIEAVAAAIIALITWQEGPLWIIFAALFLVGIGRAIKSPTYAPLISGVVDNAHFQSAAAWNGGADHTAAILGPPVGGFAVAIVGGSAPVFIASAVLLAISAVLIGTVQLRERVRVDEDLSKESILAGARFIRNSPVMLGAITLDMFAVLLGGATALLPIFAEDILHVGAAGLGVLRSAPAAGALVMSLIIAHRGPFLRAGRSLLLTVVGFGICTIVFGMSTSFPVSLAALFLLGVFDAVSMIIRETIELRYTPDDMRGRVASIHFLFIGMSNEFGEFESGVLAALIGATAAVTLGGVGTLLVVAAIAVYVPKLRDLRTIETPDALQAGHSSAG